MSVFNRFFKRYSKQLLYLSAFGTTLIVFQAPLRFIIFESQSDEYLKNPEFIKKREEVEKRRELIKSKYAEYKASSDPEERKRLKEELNQIHTNRLQQMYREAFNK